ncbi:hypothetical protein CDL12_27666 [Handroanthus impetiginosus]|uniref:Ubiquitinyl hydrolase 1 n=1 Tax=Handroanthus impetiginosus TaxID=429701 RepID=A0A2G9G3W6_9LAMI|nr:hypothetical protein CDL12_27666 [Handroanthus impetiginosus]
MGHCCILIFCPRDEEMCRDRRKSKEIPRRLYCWVYETTANKDLCVLAPVKADTATIKEQHDHGAAYEEQGDNDGEEKERKDKEDEEDKEDKEMNEERKDDEDEEEDEQKKEKIEERQDDKKNEKEDGENKEGNEKNVRKRKKEKMVTTMRSTKHHAGQVSCHHEVEMNKKLEAISRKLNFGQDVNFGEQDYEALCTLSSIIDDVQNRDELIKK